MKRYDRLYSGRSQDGTCDVLTTTTQQQAGQLVYTHDQQSNISTMHWPLEHSNSRFESIQIRYANRFVL